MGGEGHESPPDSPALGSACIYQRGPGPVHVPSKRPGLSLPFALHLLMLPSAQSSVTTPTSGPPRTNLPSTGNAAAPLPLSRSPSPPLPPPFRSVIGHNTNIWASKNAGLQKLEGSVGMLDPDEPTETFIREATLHASLPVCMRLLHARHALGPGTHYYCDHVSVPVCVCQG